MTIPSQSVNNISRIIDYNMKIKYLNLVLTCHYNMLITDKSPEFIKVVVMTC